MRQAAILPTRRHRLHLAFHARCRAVAKVPSSRASTNQAPWLVAYAKKEARDGVLRASGTRLAPTGAETEPASGAACQWHAFSADRSGAETRSPFLKLRKKRSARRGSNPRPPPWQGGAPPLSHSRIVV